LEREVIFGVVGWLSDYRTSLFLKGNDYFTQKIHDYLTLVRKKMLRLLLYDYQRTVCYYTIYRTFKRWSSDDFTTILLEKLRLLVTTIPAETLRLLLTSISYRAKARKRDAAASRQWFRPPAVGSALCPSMPGSRPPG
jgi:hypothetical protein